MGNAGPTPAGLRLAELRLHELRLEELAGREIAVWSVPDSSTTHGNPGCTSIRTSTRVAARAIGAIGDNGAVTLTEPLPAMHCRAFGPPSATPQAPLAGVLAATRQLARSALGDQLLVATRRPDPGAVPELAVLFEQLHADWCERHLPSRWTRDPEALPASLAALRDQLDAQLDAVYDHVLAELGQPAWRHAQAVATATELVTDWAKRHTATRSRERPGPTASQVTARVAQIVGEPTTRIAEQVNGGVWSRALLDALEQVASEAGRSQGLYSLTLDDDPRGRLAVIGHPHRALPPREGAGRPNEVTYVLALPGMLGEVITARESRYGVDAPHLHGPLLDTDDVDTLLDAVVEQGRYTNLDDARRACGLEPTRGYGDPRLRGPEAAPGAEPSVDQHVRIDLDAQLTIPLGRLVAIGDELGLPAGEPDAIAAQLGREFTSALLATARTFAVDHEVPTSGIRVDVTLTPAQPGAVPPA